MKQLPMWCGRAGWRSDHIARRSSQPRRGVATTAPRWLVTRWAKAGVWKKVMVVPKKWVGG